MSPPPSADPEPTSRPPQSEVVARVACTDAEREAFHGLRYRVLVETLGRELPRVDHERRLVLDDPDENDEVLFCEVDGTIVAGLRFQFGAGDLSDETIARFGLDEIPGLTRARCAFPSMMVVDEKHRSAAVIRGLLDLCYRYTLEQGLLFQFCLSAPGMLSLYERLGYRRYRPAVEVQGLGYQVPVILVAPDRAHLELVRSPFLKVLRELDTAPFPEEWFAETFPAFAHQSTQPYSDQGAWWEDVRGQILDAQPPIFAGFDPVELRHVVSRGTVLHCKAGDRIVQQGSESNEMYVVLSGLTEARTKQRHRSVLLATMGPGEVFGELGFATRDRRSADVVAVADSEVLVLSQQWFRRFTLDSPTYAARLLLNLSSLLSRRLVDRTGAWLDAVAANSPETPKRRFRDLT